MSKSLLFGRPAREKLLAGAKVVCDAVGSTLGPKSSNVCIERPFGTPQTIHDGVGVSKEIDLKDPEENLGAQLIKEAAQKTNDKAGDGTTTATILTYALASEAIKNITAGANPMILRKGMELAQKDIVEELGKLSQKVKTNEEIKQIATISAQDEMIGEMIAGAIEKLGKDCVIAVEESNTVGMDIEYKEGMQFDKGWISPYFMTKIESSEASVEDPFIVITDEKINTNTQFTEWARNIEALYTQTQAEGKDPGTIQRQMPKNIVLIVGELSGIALASVIQNKMQGFLNILAIQAPSYGEKQKEYLQDIALVTGGNLVSKDTGGSIATMKMEDFGHASRVVSTKNNTMIVKGAGDRKKISEYIKRWEHIGNLKETSEFDRERIKERVAKLTSGIAIINVGAPSEMEMREKKERCIDAIEATKAAVEEGIVTGGEVALLYASQELETGVVDDENLGYQMVLEAVKRPFKVLMENSGYNAGQMLERLNTRMQDGDIKNPGIDVIDGEVKDMIKAGIIDPVKVSRVALENAISTAGAILTTNTLITVIPEDKNDRQPVARTG